MDENRGYQGKRLQPKKRAAKFWSDYGYLLVTVAVVFVLFKVVFQLAYVPTGSMETTVPSKSLMVCWRLPYVVSDPVPERGEVVTFWSDEMASSSSSASSACRAMRFPSPAAMSISTANVWRRTTCRSRGLPPAMASFRFRTDACSCSAITAPARGTAAAGASHISPSASCRPACWSARPYSRTTAGAASAPSTNREEGTV